MEGVLKLFKATNLNYSTNASGVVTIGLFFGKKNLDKLNSTREFREPPTKHTQVQTHNTRFPKTTSESAAKTLDDIGIPPPPPLLSQEGLKMKSLDVDTCETSMPELPGDYDKRVREVHGDDFKLDEEERDIHLPTRKEIVTKTILKDVSEKTIKRVDKLDDSISKFKTQTKEDTSDFKTKVKEDTSDLKIKVKEDLKGFIAELKVFRRENSMMTAINKGLEDSNKKLMTENKHLLDKIDSLYDHYDDMIEKQKTNNKFIEKFKKYLDPIVEKETRIIKDNETLKVKIAKDNEVLKAKITAVYQNSQKVLAHAAELHEQNEEYQDKLDSMARIVVDVHKDHIEFPKIKNNIEILSTEMDAHNKLLKPLEKGSYEKDIDYIKDDLKDANSQIRLLSSALKKNETKVSLLRERIDHYKKSGKIKTSD